VRCPKCGVDEDRVVDSRQSREGDVIRRRRECASCALRFTTYERIEVTLPLIIKRDGRREPWSREKLMAGLRRACEKRPVPYASIVAIAERIEAALIERGDDEVTSLAVGERVMQELQLVDEVAWLRFASVYRSFADIGEFLHEARRLHGSAGDGDSEPGAP
jgi:transcriptional repressor NrdR